MAKILSIEIGNRNIKILEGSKKGSNLVVYKSIFLDAPSNSIEDGKIIDIDLVVETIENGLLENEVKTKNAIFTFNSNSIITRNIELPLLKRKSETISMIKNELEQLLSVDLSQYKLIFKKTETFKVEEVEKAKYIVYGLPIEMYNKYIELAEKLNLEAMVLDLSFNSLDKIVQKHVVVNNNSFSNSVAAFIEIDYSTISFSVLNNGKNDFSRISSNGIKDIVRSFSTVYNLSQEESLNYIEKLSLIEESEILSSISKTNIALDVINSWIDEFNRYIRYYNSINKDKQISRIYIFGTFSKIEGLEKYLSSHLNIEVEMVKEVSGLIIKDDTVDFDTKKYLSTFLSLFINKKDINFLADKKKARISKFNVGIVIFAMSLIIVLTSIYYLYSYFVEQVELEKEIATMDQFMQDKETIELSTETEAIINKVALLEVYKTEVKKLKEAIRNEDAVTTIMFEQLAKATPIDTKINSMSIDQSNILLQCSSISLLFTAQR